MTSPLLLFEPALLIKLIKLTTQRRNKETICQNHREFQLHVVHCTCNNNYLFQPVHKW